MNTPILHGKSTDQVRVADRVELALGVPETAAGYIFLFHFGSWVHRGFRTHGVQSAI